MPGTNFETQNSSGLSSAWGEHISSLFLSASRLPSESRPVLSFWLHLTFLKHLLTSYKWQQILFLWLTLLCWFAVFVMALSARGYLRQSFPSSDRYASWVLLDQPSGSGSRLSASPRLVQVQGKLRRHSLKICAQNHCLTIPLSWPSKNGLNLWKSPTIYLEN